MWRKDMRERVRKLRGIPWKPGRCGDAIVSKKQARDEREQEHYGGEVVCESVDPRVLPFILNAPEDMKRLLKYSEACDELLMPIFSTLQWKDGDRRAADVGALIVKLVASCQVLIQNPEMTEEAVQRIKEIIDVD